MSQELPTYFTEIADRFIPKKQRNEYFKFVKGLSPFNGSPNKCADREEYLRVKKNSTKEKLEENRLKRLDYLSKRLKSSVENHQKVSCSSENLKVPSGDINASIKNLKDLLLIGRKTERLSILTKIYIGKHANYLITLCDNDRHFFSYLLKKNGIIYSRTELHFAMKLANLSLKFPTITRLSVPLSLLKNNLSILEECLSNDEDFWRN